MTGPWRGWTQRVGLLPRMLLAIGLALTIAALVVVVIETVVVRQQLREQALELFQDTGDVLAATLAADATRTSQLMSTVSQQEFLAQEGGDDPDARGRRTLSVVRTSDPRLDLVGVVDVTSGGVRTLGLPTRAVVAPPAPEEVAPLARLSTSSRRVVPLEGGGYGLVSVQSVDRLTDAPRLLLAGFPLDRLTARRYLQETGVDAVELVVDGAVVAASDPTRTGRRPLGEWRGSEPEILDDGRLVRYVSVGADRPWDTPAAIGLVSDDPLAGLAGTLVRTSATALTLLLVLGGGLAFALSRPLTRPLRSLTRTATAVAGGDLDQAFVTDRRDEIGRLAAALERMRIGLVGQLELIQRQTDALQDATRRMVTAQDEERQRIARDLHDGIQQQLVVLRMQVGAARRELGQDPDRLDEVADRFATAIDRLLAQLRSTGQQLFPAILSDRGLGPAVFSLTARLPVQVDVRFDPDPLPRIDPQVEVNAYFLLSEAVLNAMKHARASSLQISIVATDAELRVHVHDDGAGFAVEEPTRRGGLVHMRDRVQALRGRLTVRSSPGSGTRVEAVFPLTPASSVVAALEVEQDGRHPSVEVGLLGQPELAEDGVGVLLDRSLGHGQLPGDGRVPPT